MSAPRRSRPVLHLDPAPEPGGPPDGHRHPHGAWASVHQTDPSGRSSPRVTRWTSDPSVSRRESQHVCTACPSSPTSCCVEPPRAGAVGARAFRRPLPRLAPPPRRSPAPRSARRSHAASGGSWLPQRETHRRGELLPADVLQHLVPSVPARTRRGRRGRNNAPAGFGRPTRMAPKRATMSSMSTFMASTAGGPIRKAIRAGRGVEVAAAPGGLSRPRRPASARPGASPCPRGW